MILLADTRTDRRSQARRESDQRNEHFKGVLIVAFIAISMLMLWLGIQIGERGAEQKARIISVKGESR